MNLKNFEEFESIILTIQGSAVRRDWRKVRVKELRNLHSSPCVLRVTKSAIKRWTGHVTRMRRRITAARNYWNWRHYEVWKQKGSVLKCSPKKESLRRCNRLSGLGIGCNRGHT